VLTWSGSRARTRLWLMEIVLDVFYGMLGGTNVDDEIVIALI